MSFLCSDNFVNFYRKLTSLDNSNLFFRDVQNALDFIAPDLNISRIVCEIKIDPRFSRINGNDSSNVIYHNLIGEPNEDSPVSLIATSESVGDVTYKAFQIKDTEPWDRFAKDQILFILQTLHSIASKVKLSDNFRTALSTDSLTGISNNARLVSSVNRSIRDGSIGSYCCFFMNVKRFKYYNSEYGFKNGNVIMTYVANALANFCEGGETVCRTGGDNFIMLVRKARKESWLEFINGIPMELPVNGKREKLLIQFHTGIYSARGTETNHNELLEPANAAYGIAKNVKMIPALEYTDDVKSIYEHRDLVLSTYQKAMMENDMLVYYQPKVDLTSYKLCGAEALSRWRYHGEIKTPYWYIPTLEQSNAICELDMYNLDIVCRNIRQWLDDGITPVRISINFSRRHLSNPSLVKDILNIINKYNVPKNYLEIEVTETVDTVEYSALTRFISDLHDNGLLVSIDDFGTGVSSLNLLKDIPVDIIKLDKSFLSETEFKKKLSIVISDLIKMAKDLGIHTIMEGVETKEQAEFLENIFCDAAQGYYFDKPLSHSDFTNILKRGGYIK